MKCNKCNVGKLTEVRNSPSKYPEGNHVECDNCNYHFDVFGEY